MLRLKSYNFQKNCSRKTINFFCSSFTVTSLTKIDEIYLFLKGTKKDVDDDDDQWHPEDPRAGPEIDNDQKRTLKKQRRYIHFTKRLYECGQF